MTEKEDSLRKKARSNLDPEGWEALLEGIPRVDEEKPGESTGEKNLEDPAPSDKRVHKVTDESGQVSESVTSQDGTPRAAPDETQPAPTQDAPEENTSRPASAGDEGGPSASERETETRSRRFAARLQRQPLVRRLVQYYQGLNSREQKILTSGLLFVSVILVYTFVLDPMFEKNALFNRKIERKHEELVEMMRLRSSIARDRGGLERIKKTIEQRNRGFSVFAYLEQLAAKAEMKDKIIYIKPQRETPVGPFRESLAEIKLDKISLEGLTRFLYRIESSEDLLYIKNIKIKARRFGKDQGGLEVTLSVGTLFQGRG